MTAELYINDRLVDLPANSVIALSLAVNSLYEVKTIQGNISNRIILPPTANNLEACGFAGDMNIDLTKTIRKRVTCRYIQNGVELIPVGYVELSENSDGAISLLISSGNTDFFDLVTGSIRDLSFAEFDHVWGLSAVVASRFNTEGYIYPVIDYGTLNIESTEVNPKLLRPAAFMHTIVSKIVAETGYKLENELETRSETKFVYKNAILPFTLSEFQHAERFSGQFASEAVDVRNSSTIRHEGSTNLQWPNEVADGNNLFDGTFFTAPRIMTVNVKVEFPNIHVSKTWFAGRKGTVVKLTKYDVATAQNIDLSILNFPVFEGSSDNYPNQEMTLDNVAINPGDKLFVRISILSDGDCVIQSGAKFTVQTSTALVLYGQEIQVEATLPDISKKEFLKFVASMFCAVVQTDNRNKTVRIVPFARIKDNIPFAVDWSEKITDKGVSSFLKVGDYAQRNTAKWKEDDAIVPDNYGNADLLIADENLPVQKDLFVAPFAASQESTIVGGVRTVRIAKIEDPGTGEFKITTEPRLVILDITSMELTYNDGDDSALVSGNIPLTYFNSGSTAKPDLMMTSIINRSFADLRIVLNDQRRLVLPLYLNELDIANLDFFIPVYIRRYATYFYVATISDYVGERPAKVELIKLY